MPMAQTHSTRPVIVGEVLIDRFPDGSAILGGAPFNVAWHLQGFGAAPLFISRVGADEAGDGVRAAMEDWGMDSTGLRIDSDHPTGAVEITLSGAQHTFDILADQAYDHISLEQLNETLAAQRPALIYHGSLILRTAQTHAALSGFLERAGIPLFVDINLRDPWWRAEDLPGLLQRARWVKVNDDELALIAGHLQLADDDIAVTARRLQQAFAIERLIVTLGSHGARAFQIGAQPIAVAPEPVKAVVDTVGAGDAFASISVLGLLQDWPLEVTMRRAQQFASGIVQQRGATNRDRGLYLELAQEWGLSP
jgi:fructokinase